MQIGINRTTAGPSTLVDLLRLRAESRTEGPAYTFLDDQQAEEATLDYADLDLQAKAIAAGLQGLAKPGDRVLLLYPSGLDFIAAFFGCLYAGAIAVPVVQPRPTSSFARLQAILSNAQAKLGLTTGNILKRIDPMLNRDAEFKALRWVATDEISTSLSGAWESPTIDGSTIAFIQYTSGSTSDPKGVILTHDNLLCNERIIQQAFQQTEESVIVGWLPLYHDMGLIGNVLQPLYTGARCVLMSPVNFLQRPVRWLQAISRYKATTSGGPDFAYRFCARKISSEQREDLDLSSWTVAFTGSEPIQAETLDEFARVFEPCGFRREAFYPCYGLAEATLFVSGGSKHLAPVVRSIDREELERGRVTDLEPESDGSKKAVSCGQAWPDHQIVVVDPETLTDCPPGRVGEIWISGPSVARGYWNLPEESDRNFNVFHSNSTAGPFLRTGDLGFTTAGELFLVGRIKDLIITRGRNYYPQDIEATVEQSSQALRKGCCAAFSVEVESQERLVVVQEVERRYLKEDLKEVISSMIEAVSVEHELVAYAVVLIRPGTIPKTSSGKLQRNVCRTKFLEGNLDKVEEWQSPAQFEGDSTQLLPLPAPKANESIQQRLVSILAVLLGIDSSRINLNKPLLSYGIDSLTAVNFTHRIEQDFGIVLSPTSLIQGASIIELVEQVRDLMEAGRRKTDSPIAQFAAHTGLQVLSYGQRALWFLHQLAPESAAYNIAVAMRADSELDVSSLRRAFQVLTDRHPSLRSTFSLVNETPVQRVNDRSEVCFQIQSTVNWSEKQLDIKLAEEAGRPFDLELGPLLRVNLFVQPERQSIILVVVHHIVADFWSLSVMLRELGLVYEAERSGKQVELPLLPILYADYASWQSEKLAGEEGERMWAYWQKQFPAQTPVLDLPTDRPRPATQTYRGSSLTFRLDAGLMESLRDLSLKKQMTVYVTVLAAFQMLLHRYTGQRDILVGSPTVGRTRADLSSLIGYFANPLIMRAEFLTEMSAENFLTQVRETALGAFQHQEFPFALLVERLQPERDPSRSPLFDVMFTFQQAPPGMPKDIGWFALGEAGGTIQLGETSLQSMALKSRVAQLDLTLMVAEVSNGLAGSVQYNTDLFEAATISRMAGHLEVLLRAIVDDPTQRISDLPLLTEAEQQQVLVEWNHTETEYPEQLCIHEAFQAQTERCQDSIAAVFENEQITYGELDRRSNQLAHHLRRLGARPETCVGISVYRSVNLVVGMLGVLKAGAAYLPVDPEFPKLRQSFMLVDAQVPVLLTQDTLLDRLPPHKARVVCLDSDWDQIAREDGAVVQSGVTAGNLAYVIYTSGSTGMPKGVMIAHANVMNFFAGMDAVIGGDKAGTWLAVTSVSFDISVLELLWTLTRGYRLIIQPEQREQSPGAYTDSESANKPIDFSLFYFASDDDQTPKNKYDLVFEGAKFADQHGFRSIWTPERHFHAFGGLYPSPSVMSAALAAITTRIGIRAGSVVLPLHNAIRVAEEWALVDNISSGRVGVSFASGWHANDFVFAPDSYVNRKDEMLNKIETVRQLWRGESLELPGGAGNQVEVRIRPRPIQTELPIWITAAGSSETFRIAGEIGANLLTHLLGQSMEELERNIGIYHAAWRESGRDPGAGHVTLMLHTFVDSDLRTIRGKVELPFCRYLMSSLDLAKGLLRSQGYDVEAELNADDIESLLHRGFNRYFSQSGLFGTPATCLPMIGRLKAIGVNEVACLIDFGVDADSVISSLIHLNELRQLSNQPSRHEALDDSIPAQITRHQVTHVQCTPSLSAILADDDEAREPIASLENLMVGGEKLSVSLAQRLAGIATGGLFNMYGPTETTIWSATQNLGAVATTVPIGRPIANTEINILDCNLRAVPVGVRGEIFIGGAGVVRGYLNRPELTAERFMVNAFSNEPGGRSYKTGDVARYLSDGTIEYLARVDHQVKIRGYRIEIGEIEGALRQHPAVRETVVVARENERGDKQLVAYIVKSHSEGFRPIKETSPRNVEVPHDAVPYRLSNGLAIYHHGSFQTSIIFKEIFEDEIYHQHGIVFNDGDCIFDVGANIGLFTLYASQKCKSARIYAFEPIQPSFELLRANLALNDVNANLYECGLAAKSGESKFIFYRQAAGLSSRVSTAAADTAETESIVRDWLRTVAPENSGAILPESQLKELLQEYLRAETYTCKLRTISEIIREAHIDRIDLLKVDVEKSEFEVLDGIADEDWPKIKQIVMEVHSKELLDRVCALLSRHTFFFEIDKVFAVNGEHAETEVDVYMLYALRSVVEERSAGYQLNGHRLREDPPNPTDLTNDFQMFLREKLPEYMVPSRFIVLDALPLTPNGKIDRNALPAPEDLQEKKYVSPQTPTEEALARIWSGILGVDRIGIHDNFFDIGGHSLLATRVVTRVRTRFAVDLTLRDFLRASTVNTLAAVIEELILAKSSKSKIDEMLDLLESLEEVEAQDMLAIHEDTDEA